MSEVLGASMAEDTSSTRTPVWLSGNPLAGRCKLLSACVFKSAASGMKSKRDTTGWMDLPREKQQTQFPREMSRSLDVQVHHPFPPFGVATSPLSKRLPLQPGH